jgi:transketolase
VCKEYPVPVKKLGFQDVFGESGPAKELLQKYQLDEMGIYRQVPEFVRGV